MKKIKIAISSCLLGNKVRYDGTDKRSTFCVDILSKYFELVAVCPEMGIGMPAPRPAIHLVKSADLIRVKQVDDHSKDVTNALKQYAYKCQSIFSQVSGYVLTEKSPSCGLESVKLYSEQGDLLSQNANGIFVEQIKKLYPELPMIEEQFLVDTFARNKFIHEVSAYYLK